MTIHMEINPVHLLNHQIVRDLPFGVIVVDRNLKINDWNSCMERWSGLPRAHTQDQSLLQAFPTLESRGLAKPILEVFKSCQPVVISYQECSRFLSFDPDRAPERALLMIQETEIRPLFDAEAEVAMACIIVKDVTDHIRRLEEMQELNGKLAAINDELIRANQVKNEFLQTTSHELRTPLTAILGFIDLLENDLVESPEEEKEFLDNIRNSATHLLDLINDILLAAKIQARKIELDIEPLDLTDLLTEVHALMHPVAVQKGLKFELDIGELEVQVLADYQKLKQVLFNIVGNALKFTDEGWVRMNASFQNGTQETVTVWVEDTGIGIAPDKIDLVFEKFRQADPSATRKYGGTGLGMPISQALMEHMNGGISIESEGLGKGCTVLLSIPVAKA